jgi:D,D-heptose 1,7-bisphosphate phosphatase
MAATPVEQVAILCGGLGTRLGPLTGECPKPLLAVGGRPFLDWLVGEAARHGLRRVLLLAGFAADEIARYAATTPLRERFGLTIEVAVEPRPSGTGGALWHARDRLDPRFLLLNGDSLFDINLLALATAGCPPGGVAMAVRAAPAGARYGGVEIAGGMVRAFHERGETGWINAGLYLCDRRLVDRLAPYSSLERDLFPALAHEGKLAAQPHAGFFVDIGVPESFDLAQSEVPRRMRRPAAFLDRDGVLNVDRGHVGEIGRFEWIDGAREAVRLFNDAGWLVFVVTNQAGVAKGFYAEADVAALHAHMADGLAEAGAHVDDWRYCPHHPEASGAAYRRACPWRKPQPGMLLDLIAKWDCRLEGSLLIGDKDSDLAAASAAGVAGHKFAGGCLLQFAQALLSEHLRSAHD